MARPDLSDYMGERLTVDWSVTFAGANEYYVTETVAGGVGTTRWGPLPSKTLAFDLIQERRGVFTDWLVKQIPALRSST